MSGNAGKEKKRITLGILPNVFAQGVPVVVRICYSMKVGILTYHSSYNFGANLQTLAVQEFLQRRGCHPVVINYRNPKKMEMYRAMVSSAQTEMHERFIEKYLHTSPQLSCDKDVQEYCSDELDAVFVGSDAVFRLVPRYAPKRFLRGLLGRNPSSFWYHPTDRMPVYWLPWRKNGIPKPARVSIAASTVGTQFFFLEKSLRQQACACLCDFDFISVRDDWTGLMVRCLSKGKIKPQMCPDPVFCLNDCFSIPKEEIPSVDVSKTILIASNMERKWFAQFQRVAHDHGFNICNLPNPDNGFGFDESDFTLNLPMSPLAWYALLSRAAGFIGSRFHALVSCVANKTPVISIDLSKTRRLLRMRSKTYDLCKRANAKVRYRPVQWLKCSNPRAILKLLMDKESQANMDHYAEYAKARLVTVVDEMLECVSHNRG